MTKLDQAIAKAEALLADPKPTTRWQAEVLQAQLRLAALTKKALA